MYIHQHKNWPNFTFSKAEILPILTSIHELEIKLKALMSVAGLEKVELLELDNLVIEIIKNFEIEAIRLNSDDVRSSLIKKLGLSKTLIPTKRLIDGYVEAYLDALKGRGLKLTHKNIYHWHQCLFPSGKNEYGTIIPVGRYRNRKDGRMTVSSGMLGKDIIHFEAPSGEDVSNEMKNFVAWINTADYNNDILKSAIAHLYFMAIHPLNDGNGRIGRIISDRIVNKSNDIVKYYSISEQIQGQKKAYYEILEATQKQRSMDISNYLVWYLDIAYKALRVAETRISKIFIEVKFYDQYRHVLLNERQKRIIDLIFKNEVFNKLNTSKYAKQFDISKETASRDLTYLFQHGLLAKLAAGGRETAYYIKHLGLPNEKEFGQQKQLGFIIEE